MSEQEWVEAMCTAMGTNKSDAKPVISGEDLNGILGASLNLEIWSHRMK